MFADVRRRQFAPRFRIHQSPVSYFRRSRTHTWKGEHTFALIHFKQCVPLFSLVFTYMQTIFSSTKLQQLILLRILIAVAYRAVWCAGTDFVPGAVPANLKYTASSPVAVNQGSSLQQQDKHINYSLSINKWFWGHHKSSLPRCSWQYKSRAWLTVVFQMWTHLSKEPLARCLPSGLKATL